MELLLSVSLLAQETKFNEQEKLVLGIYLTMLFKITILSVFENKFGKQLIEINGVTQFVQLWMI